MKLISVILKRAQDSPYFNYNMAITIAPNPAIKITPVAKTFGAELSGLDFSKPLNDADFKVVQEAMEKYGVLVLRKSNFEDETLIEFGRRFGTLDTATPHYSAKLPPRLTLAEIFDISNLNSRNEIYDESEPMRVSIANANLLWHSDGQYNPLRTSWSMLRAVELPPKGTGGETDYLDCRAAYEDLSDEMKKRIDGLVGMNNMHHRVKVGNPNMEEYQKMNPLEYPFAKHKIALIHEATGRGTLYLSAYTHHIEGMPVEEGQKLLAELFDHMKQEKYQLSVHYENPGDVVIWDNTSVLHRATAGSFRGKYRRDMRRVSVLDSSKDCYGLNTEADMWRQGAP